MIIVANFLSPHLDDLAREYSEVMAAALGEPVRFEAGALVDELREGRVGVAFICGLAYALLHDADPEHISPVAAPLVADPRSRAAPVYFSEIVVPADSGARSLADLSGARLAYNEPVSFSGYRALEHVLESRALTWELFSERIRTGSHRGSLDALLQGDADAAAIDSHVLWLERQRDAGLAGAVKVIESLGPYPAPPLAVHRIGCDVSEDYLYQLLDRLPVAGLGVVGIERWQPVDDGYYDAIRQVTAGLPGLEL